MDITELLQQETLPQVPRVSVAALKPDDVVVIECEEPLPRKVVDYIKSVVEENIPGRKVLVFDAGIKMRVFSSGLQVGDEMRMSTELLQELASLEGGVSHRVLVQDIRVEKDGTKTLILSMVVPLGTPHA